MVILLNGHTNFTYLGYDTIWTKVSAYGELERKLWGLTVLSLIGILTKLTKKYSL